MKTLTESSGYLDSHNSTDSVKLFSNCRHHLGRSGLTEPTIQKWDCFSINSPNGMLLKPFAKVVITLTVIFEQSASEDVRWVR